MALLVKLLIGLVVLGIAGAGGAYFLYGAQNIGLDEFVLDGIRDITARSFSFDGSLHIRNPSKTSVPIESVLYDVILKDTGETISSGNLPLFTLRAKETTTVPFLQEVNWIPTVSLATQLASKSKVFVIVKGTIKINTPALRNYAIPFTKEVDIKPYMMQFVPVDTTPATGVLNSITDAEEDTEGSEPADEAESDESNSALPGLIG